MLNRYIDFEMGNLLRSPNQTVHRIADKSGSR